MKDLIKNIKSVSVVFSPSSPITDFIKNAQTFGRIKVDTSSVSSLSGHLEILADKVDFRTGNINILQVIDVCNGAGTTSGIFIQNLLLFTIREKNKVVKYNSDGQSLLSELVLTIAPEDISAVTQFKVAVSSNGQGVCVVDSDKMTLLQTLNLPGIPVYGISFVNEELFITCHGSTLTWINLSSGQTINQKTTRGQSYFVLSLSQTDYMYADSRTSVDYVVGNTKKFTYTNSEFDYPRGIGIDCMGNLYIATYGSRNIHQITNGGELIRKIPASTVGIENPWTIRFAPGSNKFIVTCNSSGKAALCEIVSNLLSELALPYAPEDIAVVTQFKVAVSSNRQGVCVVDSDMKILLQTLNLPGIPVCGISFVNEELFITCHGSTLTWINLSSGQTINQKTTRGDSFFVSSLSQTDYMYPEIADITPSVNYAVGNTKKFTYTNSEFYNPRLFGQFYTLQHIVLETFTK
ncbi:unnamed protein product [Mytilus edulis]|uniref:SMP-30/Gluconolactonase/LRE-like region domain-containing protein n=1 Tax=Mytilus edulis TaxID=6550 RepID=A0A8S3T5V2_MYTED|nr:unnamed protein product [Mytilus edulis]